MNICENCGKEHGGSYGSGRFCDNKCARGFSTKGKRVEINEKVSDKLRKYHVGVVRLCENCGNVIPKKTRQETKTCSGSCARKLSWSGEEYRNVVTNAIQKRCGTIEERLRLKEIGRLGGFGKKGYTENGIYYESLLEKKCFEFLDNNDIKYTPHKSIPNSSKVSDIYLDNLNIWVELDGIDREKRKQWLGENYDYWLKKIKIYEIEGLEFYVIKTFSEFVLFIENRGIV